MPMSDVPRAMVVKRQRIRATTVLAATSTVPYHTIKNFPGQTDLPITEGCGSLNAS